MPRYPSDLNPYQAAGMVGAIVIGGFGILAGLEHRASGTNLDLVAPDSTYLACEGPRVASQGQLRPGAPLENKGLGADSTGCRTREPQH